MKQPCSCSCCCFYCCCSYCLHCCCFCSIVYNALSTSVQALVDTDVRIIRIAWTCFVCNWEHNMYLLASRKGWLVEIYATSLGRLSSVATSILPMQSNLRTANRVSTCVCSSVYLYSLPLDLWQNRYRMRKARNAVACHRTHTTITPYLQTPDHQV